MVYHENVAAPAAPGEDRSLALAFVNSLRADRHGVVDDLADVDGLRAWLHERAAAPTELRPRADDVARAQGLRRAIREVLTALLENRRPSDIALGTLADAAAAAPGAPALSWQPDGRGGSLVSGWREVGGDEVDRVLAAMARDAMALATDARAAALGRCEAPRCVRLLLRDHNRRRWCSTGCGDRVRGARYHARHDHGEL
jgi:predicted RNA-binding Zn ribbon-like protein